MVVSHYDPIPVNCSSVGLYKERSGKSLPLYRRIANNDHCYTPFFFVVWEGAVIPPPIHNILEIRRKQICDVNLLPQR